jgi:hypothetical protein
MNDNPFFIALVAVFFAVIGIIIGVISSNAGFAADCTKLGAMRIDGKVFVCSPK